MFSLPQIPVRANLPVGNNLQDHPTCVIEYLVDRPPSINVDEALHNKSNQDYQQLLFFKSGGAASSRFVYTSYTHLQVLLINSSPKHIYMCNTNLF